MKIVQINSVYNQGSTGRIVADIHHLLESNQIESTVFFGRGTVVNDKKVHKISNTVNVYLDVIMTRLFNRHSETNQKNTLRLIEQIEMISPDIIHLHNIHGYYLNYEVLFKKLAELDIPVIWLLHDQWAMSGSSAYFDEQNMDWNKPDKRTLIEMSKEYPKHLYTGKFNVIRTLKKKEQSFNIEKLTIITPSLWLKSVCDKTFFKTKKIKVINNGIDLTKFKPLPSKKYEKKKILGVSNIWDNRKGLEYFNRLASEIGEQVDITIVGLSSEQKKTVHPTIHCIAKTNSIDELVQLYSSADVLVNPTLQDNFPTVNIEAQACGTPVITFDTGGSGETIIPGITGQIVKKADYEELKRTILEFPRKNPQIISACVANSKEYSKEKMLDKYIDLYKEVLSFTQSNDK